MIEKYSKKISLIILSIIMILLLTGCTYNNNGKDYTENLKSKIEEEISYLDNKIFEIFLKMEKNQYLSTIDGKEEINWTYVENDILTLDKNFNSIFLDLGLEELKINKDELVNLRNQLNSVIETIKLQNEVLFLGSLNNYYIELVNIYIKHSSDNNMITKKQVKVNMVKSYVLYLNNNVEESKVALNAGIDKYNEAMNNYDYITVNNYNLNKIYIIMQEYKKELETPDADPNILKIKIIEFLEEI